MGILNRLKRNEYEGFKDFICSLETTTELKRKDILMSAMLEDPIFTTWVVKNLKTIDHFLNLSTDQIEAVLKIIPNSPLILARAFYKNEKMQSMKDQIVPRYLQTDYKEFSSMIKELRKAEQEGAQFTILRYTRELQRKEEITGFMWNLPPIELMKEDKMQNYTGDFEVKFESGQLAAKGQIVKNFRVGDWNHFYENGQLMAKGNYDQGNKHGEWNFWYSNGKLRSNGYFKNDFKYGAWKEYDRNGIENIVEHK